LKLCKIGGGKFKGEKKNFGFLFVWKWGGGGGGVNIKGFFGILKILDFLNELNIIYWL